MPRIHARADWNGYDDDDPIEPVLDVEVSLLAAPGATVDWVHSRRDEAIRHTVDRASALFGGQFGGVVEHVGHSNFNHHGMTAHLVIAARVTKETVDAIEHRTRTMERSLETTLQSHFGWEQAAVSVQIDPHPSYEARRGATPKPRPGKPDDVNVWQPPGGSNAIAPVIVTMPGASVRDDIHITPVQPPVEQKQSSTAVAGLLGAVLAVGVAIFVGLAIGPLTSEISFLQDERRVTAIETAAALELRNERIAALQRENGRLSGTVNRLASRRGQPAARQDQPTRTLPDTAPLGPMAAASPPPL